MRDFWMSLFAALLTLCGLFGLISGYDPDVAVPPLANMVGEGTDYMRREHSLIKPYQGNQLSLRAFDVINLVSFHN